MESKSLYSQRDTDAEDHDDSGAQGISVVTTADVDGVDDDDDCWASGIECLFLLLETAAGVTDWMPLMLGRGACNCRIWASRSSSRSKWRPQWWQRKANSPVCDTRWALRENLVPYPWPQSGHRYKCCCCFIQDVLSGPVEAALLVDDVSPSSLPTTSSNEKKSHTIVNFAIEWALIPDPFQNVHRVTDA